MLLLAITWNAILAEVLVLIAIAIILFLVFRIGTSILKLLFGVIANSVLGVVSLFLLNYIFGLAIPISAAIVLAVAVFGLPAVGTLVILKVFGVPLM